jgi:hypothetical protein
MSGKRAKQERKALRELIGPLVPVMEQALNEMHGDASLLTKWVAMASVIKQLNPDIPLEQLLPNSLENTIGKYNPDLLIEDSP